MNIPLIAGALYTVMSAATFLLFWIDKRAAARNAPRIPENTLHLAELLGGWPGAMLGQRLLRHKSSKLGYRIMLWAIAAAHIAAWVWIAMSRR